jgi:hypothetical protein
MEREYFIRKMLMLGAELGETSDNIRISMIVNDAELLTKKYESELKKLRIADVSECVHPLAELVSGDEGLFCCKCQKYVRSNAHIH